MIDLIKKRFKSKTYGLGFIVMILSYAQANSVLLKPILADNFGIVMFVIGLAIMIIRELTTGAVSDK